ncbi:hypothetical protein V7968_28315 [Nocardia vulneris]|uniref:hypothetical protein n=1 Tax=Nocardia vulneris TaxID=1141657 RepID=UPI0030CCF00A
MSVAGIWDLTIATRLGDIKVVLELQQDDGVLTGTARASGKKRPLDDLEFDGELLSWRQTLTRRLMRLDLAFAMTTEGDRMSGTCVTGRFPAVHVAGARRA